MTRRARSNVWFAAAFLLAFALFFAAPKSWGTISIPFPGPGMPASTTATPTIVFQQTATDVTVQTTYNMGTPNCGTASTTRKVFLLISGRGNATITAASTTISGVAVTKAVEVNQGTTISTIVVADVPTAVNSGSTCAVSLTFSTSITRVAIGVYSSDNLTSLTATATNTSTANPLSLNVNTVGSRVLLANATTNSTSTVSWVGVTQDYSDNASFASQQFTGGSLATSSTETPRTVSQTFGTNSNQSGASAVFQ